MQLYLVLMYCFLLAIRHFILWKPITLHIRFAFDLIMSIFSFSLDSFASWDLFLRQTQVWRHHMMPLGRTLKLFYLCIAFVPQEMALPVTQNFVFCSFFIDWWQETVLRYSVRASHTSVVYIFGSHWCKAVYIQLVWCIEAFSLHNAFQCSGNEMCVQLNLVKIFY